MKSSSARPLAIITLSLLGFLLIVSLVSERSGFKLTGEEMLAVVSGKNYEVKLGDLSQTDKVLFLDLRSARDFALANPELNVINIPIGAMLEDQYKTVLASDAKKIILPHDPTQAHQAWMLLTQLGHEDIYVLESDSVPPN